MTQIYLDEKRAIRQVTEFNGFSSESEQLESVNSLFD
jgi:hypothetical protein